MKQPYQTAVLRYPRTLDNDVLSKDANCGKCHRYHVIHPTIKPVTAYHRAKVFTTDVACEVFTDETGV